MFSEVDSTIFPDSCEVIQVASQHFVYPIFKCGSTSLIESMKEKDWAFVPMEDIKNIKDPITVFLRNPRERFLSGVNTYVQHLGNDFDTHTVLYFVNQYLFLNRHYAPQFFWLLNLARFAGIDSLVTLRNMSDIKELTNAHSHAYVEPISEAFKQHVESFNWDKLELYFFLDQILLEHIGQTISIRDLLLYIKTKQPELYNLIFKKSLDIANVLS